MKLPAVVFILSAFTGALVACEEGSVPDTGTLAGGLTTTLDAAHDGVYLIAVTDGTTGTVCGATLLAPTILLTAASCVDPRVVAPGRKVYAFQDFAAFLQKPQSFPSAIAQLIAPGYDPKTTAGAHDFAVLRFAQPLPGTPLKVNYHTMTQEAVGTPVHLVGYPALDGGRLAARTTLTSTVQRVEPTNFAFDGRNAHFAFEGFPVLRSFGPDERLVAVSYAVVTPQEWTLATKLDGERQFLSAYASCAPSCSGRQCGEDGCGGTCGTCPLATEVCSAQGLCLAGTVVDGGTPDASSAAPAASEDAGLAAMAPASPAPATDAGSRAREAPVLSPQTASSFACTTAGVGGFDALPLVGSLAFSLALRRRRARRTPAHD